MALSLKHTSHSYDSHKQDNTPDMFYALRPDHILLVEDDPANLLVASTLLETFGYPFDIATSGYEAVEKADRCFYPVIIMDMRMPDISGLQATSLIRENERKPGRHASKIICVTANALIGEHERCIASGMDDYLSKPYKLEELRDKLRIIFTAISDNSE
ncbi:MAG: response regulator receiver protein [Alphaproteobacteria bacterium]|nr:response regulator receiver protein [Alphaproteobacteria bacterium]